MSSGIGDMVNDWVFMCDSFTFLVIASLYEIFYHKTYQRVTKYRLRRSIKHVCESNLQEKPTRLHIKEVLVGFLH